MIYVVYGHTLSGKTTLAKKLEEELGIETIVTSTDRPIRDGEKDGIDYYFHDIGDIDRTSHFGIREFFTVYRKEPFTYGIAHDSIKDYTKRDRVIVLDPQGYKSLKEEVGAEHLVSIYMNIPERELIARAVKRGDEEKEIVRRLNDDNKLFINADIYSDLVFENNEEAFSVMKSIINKEVGY